MIVQRETLGETAATMPSRTAIHRATRRRRSRSQRPVRLEPWSIVSAPNIGSTVPSGDGQPQPAAALQLGLRGLRLAAVVEEAVDRRAGAADVGAEGAERAQIVGGGR